MVSRADFLKGAVAGGAGLALLSSIGCSGSVVAPNVVPSPGGIAWDSLAKLLSGRLVRPGDRGYAALALPNNLRYASTLPGGIAMCKDAADVSKSILWARENGVPLVARSGGHSYAGYSTTTGLMIDLTGMRSVSYDPGTGIATLGGGVRNIDAERAFRPLNVAVTHGRCFRVGVAGLVLGGGVGFNMRPNGLTCDQLIGTELVTADGAIHTVSQTEKANLLWACRGAGGGNLGINTSFEFQTYPVGPITVFDLEWSENQEQIFAALCRALESAPREVGCKISAERVGVGHGPILIRLLGQYNGPVDKMREILAPVYAIAAPYPGHMFHTSYWHGQDYISELGVPAYFQERSRFFQQAVSDEAVATAFKWLSHWPATAKAATFKLFQTGGVMNEVAPTASAFVHRNSVWLSSISLEWFESTTAAQLQTNLEWLDGFYQAIAPIAGGGAYQNFIDPSLADWKSAYYGENLARLEAIKRQVDPDHVFRFPEAIP